MPAVQALSQHATTAWTATHVDRVRTRSDAGQPAFQLKPDNGPVREAPVATRGAGHDRALLDGYRFVQAWLHAAARGNGIIATGSSVLGKLLPALGVASGAAQVWKGWNELDSHDGGPLSIIGSRTGRSGLLNVPAGALAFVSGVGTAIGGAITRRGAGVRRRQARPPARRDPAGSVRPHAPRARLTSRSRCGCARIG